MIKNYNDFINALKLCGFSMGGGNDEGIYSVIPWSWNETPPYETPVRWHTGDPESDPWEWRIRVLDERCDIAYGKLFFKKSGYITKQWYPYFLAARRGVCDFTDEYESGCFSRSAKCIYELIQENVAVPLHAIKKLCGVNKDDKPAFDRAITDLQMKLYITMCGREQKKSKLGLEYGWSSTVFCTTEQFWGDEIFEQAAKTDKQQAIELITRQVYKLNPNAQKKKIIKFIMGE